MLIPGIVGVIRRRILVNFRVDPEVMQRFLPASEFFEQGSLGYSDTADRHRLDGLRLVTKDWRVTALDVEHVRSSLFDDPALFPPGSVEFDCALVMRDIEHEWQAADDLQLPDDVRAPLCPSGRRAASATIRSGRVYTS